MGSRSASREASASEGATVLVGQVIRPHGLRGELKIQIHSDVDDRFVPGAELIVVPVRGAVRRLEIERFRPTGATGLLRFVGHEVIEDVEELRGARLEVARSEVPEAPAGSFYYFDLVGCRCFDAEEGELGQVSDLIEDGGGALLRIEKDGRSLLVPFVEAFLVQVDVAAKRIDLRLPPGLLEACASAS